MAAVWVEQQLHSGTVRSTRENPLAECQILLKGIHNSQALHLFMCSFFLKQTHPLMLRIETFAKSKSHQNTDSLNFWATYYSWQWYTRADSHDRYCTYSLFSPTFCQHWLGGEKALAVQFLSRWWFQKIVMFTATWGNDPIWLIFFKCVEATNQLSSSIYGSFHVCFL